MKQARMFRAELDRWASWWKGVEVFLDRIEGAKGEDEPHRRVLEALLAVAALAEQQQVSRTGEGLLAPYLAGPASLEPADRKLRLPGVDEAEIAVAGVPVEGDEVADFVWLPAAVTLWSAEIDGVDLTVRVPSWPFTAAATPRLEDDDVAELFGPERRKKAALAGLVHDVDVSSSEGPGPEEPMAWSALVAARRAESPSLPPGDELPRLDAALVDAIRLSVSVARGLFLPGYHHETGTRDAAEAVDQLHHALTLALAGITASETGALAVLEQEGHESTDYVQGFADAVAGPLDAYEELAAGLGALADAIADGDPLAAPADRVDAALDRALVSSGHELLERAVEQTQLAVWLDEALDTRVAYPDGTLRPLRTLELAFRAHWLRQLRMFQRRLRRFLDPRWALFRQSFTRRLASYVGGSGLTFEIGGLALESAVSVGSEQLVVDAPPAFSGLEVVEPGQIAVLGGDRPAGALVLGVSQSGGRLALAIAPLRISIAGGAGVPGTPGVVVEGTALGTSSPGLTAEALRTGEHPDGAAADGLVEVAVSTWSRLCLLFGRAAVDADLGGLAPADPGRPLEQTPLYGTLDPSARLLVLRGLPEVHLERVDGEVVPRVARPGELLLLQGQTEGGQAMTGVAEIDSVVSFKASRLGQLEGGGWAELSTTPLEDAEGQGCGLGSLCTPDEDLVLVTLRSLDLVDPLISTSSTPASGRLTLRRDFSGFDPPSVGAGALLPEDVLTALGRTQSPPLPGVDRRAEFGCALRTLSGWVRYAPAVGTP